MAVIDLRGSIEGPLARIGGGIGQIITAIKGPDAAARKAFFKNIQDDPDLLNNFSKIARDNPGVLQQIFPFLRDEDVASFMDVLPTLEDLREDIERPGLTPETAGGELPPEVASAIGEFARARTVGTTPTGLALEPKRVAAAEAIPQEAVTAGLRREVTGVTPLTPAQEAEETFRAEIFNLATDALEKIPLEDREKAAIRDKLPELFFDVDRLQLFKDRKALAEMQIDAQTLDRARERMESQERAIAAKWVSDTGVGLPETWQLFLFTREMNDRAKGLAAETPRILPQNDTDIRLMEVARAFDQVGQAEKITAGASIEKQIGIIIDRINEADDFGVFALEGSVREFYKDLLNSKFIELNIVSEGGIPIRIAEIKKTRFGFGDEALIIMDESGQPIEGFEETPAPPELNFQTVDASQLSSNDRDNLVRLMNGEGTMEELLRDAPLSAQRILDARRNK